jgi:hypothetical protein
MEERAHVWLMQDEEGHRYILCTDDPMPPVRAVMHIGMYDVPDILGGWGEAATVAEAEGKSRSVPVEYESRFAG